MSWGLQTESEGAGYTGVCWVKLLKVYGLWPRETSYKGIRTSTGLAWEQVQNKPEVSGILARSSVGVCSLPLGTAWMAALKNESLSRPQGSYLKVISKTRE